MLDTRSLQRTLFRMQADEAFAITLLDGDEAAWATTGLGAEERALILAGVDRAALSADPGGKRRTQILGNVASEYTTSLAALAQDGRGDVLDLFLGSPEFHHALRSEGRLPLSFGDYLARRAAEEERGDWAALIELERALSRLRREGRGGIVVAGEPIVEGDPAARALRLSPSARLLVLPGGTHQRAQAWRATLEGAVAPAEIATGEPETLLLVANGAPGPHRLADVRVELLAPPADALLGNAELLASPAERAAFARTHGAEPEDLEAFLAEFVAEGVLEPHP